jgi:hypothetical protein
VEAVAGGADAEGPPDEPVGEGVLAEVRYESACHHKARASRSLPPGVPRQRDRADQPTGLEKVAQSDREG